MSHDAIVVNPSQDVLLDLNIQPAFMSGGGLPVAGGDEIVPIVKEVHRHFTRRQRFLTLERHPRGHISLASSYEGFAPGDELTPMKIAGWNAAGKKGSYVAPYRGLADGAGFTLAQLHSYLCKTSRGLILRPDHALAGSGEDALHPEIEPFDYAYAQICGAAPSSDTYSAFRDDLWRPTGLDRIIRKSLPGAKRVFLTGLSHGDQIGNTALDAMHHGFMVVIIADATPFIRVNRFHLDSEAMLKSRGVRLARSSELRSA